MNSLLLKHISLDLLLRVAALAQLAIAILNLFLIRIMKWKPDLDRAPLLIHEVFRIHVVFISFTLSIFAALTWRFAREARAAGGRWAIWPAVAFVFFWFVRSIMKWLNCSTNLWRGIFLRTLIHWALFLGYAKRAIKGKSTRLTSTHGC